MLMLEPGRCNDQAERFCGIPGNCSAEGGREAQSRGGGRSFPSDSMAVARGADSRVIRGRGLTEFLGALPAPVPQGS